MFYNVLIATLRTSAIRRFSLKNALLRWFLRPIPPVSNFQTPGSRQVAKLHGLSGFIAYLGRRAVVVSVAGNIDPRVGRTISCPEQLVAVGFPRQYQP